MMQQSKIDPTGQSRERRFIDLSAAASLFKDTKTVRGGCEMKRYGPSGRRAQNASAALRIFVRHPKKTFATWDNSGIEPDKGKGISSPGKYGASLMRPCNDGERQWNFMSDLTCR